MIRLAIATLALACASAVSGEAAQTPPAQAAPSAEGMVGPALYVTDHERSLKFYTEGLGMTVRMRFGPPAKPDMVVGFGRNPLDTGIMLLTDKGATPRGPITHGYGFDRIALRVADLRTINARMQAAGFAPGEIKVVHGAVQMMMLTDPDGYRIELIDSKPAPRAQ